MSTISKKMLQAAAGRDTGGIQYVGGYCTNVVASTSDITITFGGNLTGGIDSSASTDDIVIVFWSVADFNRTRTITDYTKIGESFGSDSRDVDFSAFYKFMGATPDTSFVIQGGTINSGAGAAVAVEVWRGVDLTNPLDVTSVFASGSNTAKCNPASITPVSSGAVVVAGGGAGHFRSGALFSSSLDGFKTAVGALFTTTTIGMGYKATSGTYDPSAFGFTAADSTSFSWAAVTLALRPV